MKYIYNLQFVEYSQLSAHSSRLQKAAMGFTTTATAYMTVTKAIATAATDNVEFDAAIAANETAIETTAKAVVQGVMAVAMNSCEPWPLLRLEGDKSDT